MTVNLMSTQNNYTTKFFTAFVRVVGVTNQQHTKFPEETTGVILLATELNSKL